MARKRGPNPRPGREVKRGLNRTLGQPTPGMRILRRVDRKLKNVEWKFYVGWGQGQVIQDSVRTVRDLMNVVAMEYGHYHARQS